MFMKDSKGKKKHLRYEVRRPFVLCKVRGTEKVIQAESKLIKIKSGDSDLVLKG